MLAAALSLGLVPNAAKAQADLCPNAALRIGAAARLLDCRAYELVSPRSNHAAIDRGRTLASGDTMVYVSNDAPDNANSGLGGFNFVRSARNAATGWTEVSLAPRLTTPITAFASVNAQGGISEDLTSTLVASDQPLSGESVPSGLNYFIGRADGTFTLISRVPGPFSASFKVYPVQPLSGSTSDFSHLYFTPQPKQSPSDPDGNFYVWSADKGLRLGGVLPDGTPAPNGVSFQGNSDDGRYVVFTTDGRLYVRIDDERTVDVGEINIDPGNSRLTDQVMVPDRGGKVLFTSRTAQTSDANTVGKDLYSYDVTSDALTDLTVDANPEDAATGAEVQKVFGATADGAYIYFAAQGGLADGAIPGQTSIYVWHDGTVQFVARGDGSILPDGAARGTYVTPDGRHFVFFSTDSLTGYDNNDPVTRLPHVELFIATIGSGIECASCRVDGTPPTGDSTPPGVPLAGIAGAAPPRFASDDGRRVFFQSEDAVVPQASNGLQKVFEYANGRPAPISPVDSSWTATLLDVSASGDDVFFTSLDTLVRSPNAGDAAVFDARVGGGFPEGAVETCSGGACHGSRVPDPVLPSAASISFLADQGAATSAGASRVAVAKAKTIRGTVGSVQVKVPGKGRLTVSGAGLEAKRLSLSKAQTVAVKLVLTRNATTTLRKKRSFKSTVRVVFAASEGASSTVRLSVTFRAAAVRKHR